MSDLITILHVVIYNIQDDSAHACRQCKQKFNGDNFRDIFKIRESSDGLQTVHTVQITFIFIDFRVCDFAFAFKTQNAPCVSRFKRVLFSDRFQFAF